MYFQKVPKVSKCVKRVQKVQKVPKSAKKCEKGPLYQCLLYSWKPSKHHFPRSKDLGTWNFLSMFFHPPLVTCHLSRVKCHASGVRCHMSLPSRKSWHYVPNIYRFPLTGLPEKESYSEHGDYHTSNFSKRIFIEFFLSENTRILSFLTKHVSR